jgi:NADPH:quinone reductase-like Zn-dependent oxidoreductase
VDRLRDRTHPCARSDISLPGPITAPDSLVDIELPRPSATGRDLLVEVRAVSVNPVDYKVRSSAAPPAGAAIAYGNQ